ncbi:hypothetical protein WICMUC_000190 [Wickerhamomyces mucosus]|uniref:Major facilitator superfamily (MFS) profile domain-containing protein n=1 Tax=Wickerhamomyces mucosus TaxID=1378264 RepID=A0A9P8TJ50_9ASCO|nr:hypothetical protein WICMUC_000190 [Wickerhamomyces mucosus]
MSSSIREVTSAEEEFNNEDKFQNQSKQPTFRLFIQTLKSMFIWYPTNYPKAERRYLLKLDLSIMIYACLSFFAKFLDQTNITNAYVSGMEEDLKLFHNELNWLNITYLSGYVFAQVPFLALISRPKYSKYVLPTLEILYGICTFCQSKVQTVNQLYAIRFLVGVFEAPSFAGIYYGTEGWRGNPSEIFVRAATWFLCSSVGTMFSGYLQSAAYTHLNGIGGLSGWRWLFVIDGIITIPIAFIGFAFWVGPPESGKPWFFTDDEYALTLERRQRYKIEKAGKLDFEVIKRTFSTWHWYLYVLSYIFMLMTHYPSAYLTLWMKSKKTYSVPQIDNYPTILNAVSIVSIFVGSSLAAVISLWKVFVAANSMYTIYYIIMIIYDVPDGLVFFAFFVTGVGASVSTILFTTVNRVLRTDQEKKAIVMGSMMGIGYFVYTWAPLGMFPTHSKNAANAAPRWKIGYPISFVFSLLQTASFVLTTYLNYRDNKTNKLMNNLEDSDDGNNAGSSVIELTTGQTEKDTGLTEVRLVSSTRSDNSF